MSSSDTFSPLGGTAMPVSTKRDAPQQVERKLATDPIADRNRELNKEHGAKVPSPFESVAGGARRCWQCGPALFVGGEPA